MVTCGSPILRSPHVDSRKRKRVWKTHRALANGTSWALWLAVAALSQLQPVGSDHPTIAETLSENSPGSTLIWNSVCIVDLIDVWRIVIMYHVTIICDLSLHHSSHQGQKAPAGRVVLCHQPKELWACLPGGTLRCHQTWREEIPEVNGGFSWEINYKWLAHFWRQTVLRCLTIRQVPSSVTRTLTPTSRSHRGWHVRPDGMIIVAHDTWPQ